MRLLKILFFVFTVSVAAFGLFPGCANIVPPSGGPRDSIPPLLLEADPPDSSTNARFREIYLQFDEYVDVRDLRNNFVITPTMNTDPEVTSQGKSIRIRFRDSLESNTTYVLQFGKSIVDVNEGNVLPDLTYSFSTGPYMDSLEITGKVILAETGGIDSTLSVVLHRDLTDSAVTRRPPYVVKLNRMGEFRFRYLPTDTFAIYAIGGSTGNQRTYMQETQLFAFLDHPVVSGVSDSVVLYAWRGKQPNLNQGQGGLGNPGVGIQTKIPSTDRRLRFTIPPGAHDVEEDFVISFPVPLGSFDSTKIALSVDTLYTPVPFTAMLDSSSRKLQISAGWQEDKRYNIELQKDFASDTSGRQLLKTDTVFFNTKKPSDYASLSIRLKNVDLSLNPVLQFVQNNAVVFSASVKGGVFSDNRFNPGEYELRILYDENNNGKWDPGKFYGDKKQPEKVMPIQRTITVKPAWDNEFDIAL